MTRLAYVGTGDANTLVAVPLSLAQFRVPRPSFEADSGAGRDPREMARAFADSIRVEPVQNAKVAIVPLRGSGSATPDTAHAIRAVTDDRGSVLLDDQTPPLFAPSEYLVFWTYHQEIYDEVIEALEDPARASTTLRERAFQHFSFVPRPEICEVTLPMLTTEEMPWQIAALLTSVAEGPMPIVRQSRRFGPRSSAVLVEQIDHHYAIIDRSLPFASTYVTELLIAYSAALLSRTAPEWTYLAKILEMIGCERAGTPPTFAGSPASTFARADVYDAYFAYSLAAARAPAVERRSFSNSLGGTITGGMGLWEAEARNVLRQSLGQAVHPLLSTDARGERRFSSTELVIGRQFTELFEYYFDYFRFAIHERSQGAETTLRRVLDEQERELRSIMRWCQSLLDRHATEVLLWARMHEHMRDLDEVSDMWNRAATIRLDRGIQFYQGIADRIERDDLLRRSLTGLASIADNGASLFTAVCDEFCRTIQIRHEMRARDVEEFVRSFFGYYGAMTGQTVAIPGRDRARLIVNHATGQVALEPGRSTTAEFHFLVNGSHDAWPRAVASDTRRRGERYEYAPDQPVTIIEHEQFANRHIPAALQGVIGVAQAMSTALAMQELTMEMSARNIRTCVEVAQGTLSTVESFASLMALVLRRQRHPDRRIASWLGMEGLHPSAALGRAATRIGRVATLVGIGLNTYDGAMIFYSTTGDLQRARDRGDHVGMGVARFRGTAFFGTAFVEGCALLLTATGGAGAGFLAIVSAAVAITVVAVDVSAFLATGGPSHLEQMQTAYIDAKRTEIYGGQREMRASSERPRTLTELRHLRATLETIAAG